MTSASGSSCSQTTRWPDFEGTVSALDGSSVKTMLRRSRSALADASGGF